MKDLLLEAYLRGQQVKNTFPHNIETGNLAVTLILVHKYTLCTHSTQPSFLTYDIL